MDGRLFRSVGSKSSLVASNVRFLRESMDFTQKELAAKMGETYNRHFIARVEKTGHIDISDLDALASALRLTDPMTIVRVNYKNNALKLRNLC